MKLTKQKWIFALITLLFLLTACSSSEDEGTVTLTISAAVSLTDALEEIKEAYEAEHDVELTFNLAGSGTLTQQLQQGAPVDLFISANQQWMDTLEEDNIILPDTRSDVTGNRLVLIAHTDSTLSYHSFEEITPEDVSDIAVGNPESVPAGSYTKEALTSIGMWEDVQDQVILAKDVRQVLTYIETGNADIGFVYESDALSSDQVQILATAEDNHHEPITYPGAVIADTNHEEDAKKLLDYLLSADAQNILATHGFNK